MLIAGHATVNGGKRRSGMWADRLPILAIIEKDVSLRSMV